MESWLEHFAQTAFRRSADTAHDLKTPLNVAVLNLELLRMRVRKLAQGAEDEKLGNYAHSIEVELRRMARIFDTFFLLSTPPKTEDAPHAFDVVPAVAEAAQSGGVAVRDEGGAAMVHAHESRIRQALKLFFEGAARVLDPAGITADVHRNGAYQLALTGTPAADVELPKIFKFYYTDPAGNPDLSLAAARLIFETYGGELIAAEESGKVTLRLSLPSGEQ